ncbi:MAG: hypothetical protein AMS24_02510 [Chlamydiae bacterium SM23_39]|nr:MAG: hypothetical protein AMS24_02510 [Chlamydiae bacterium SM23_39]
MKKKIFILLYLFLAFVLTFFLIDLVFLKEDKDRIVIGAKNIAESQIISEMISLLIEKNTDLKVVKKYHLEGSFINFNAMKAGDIDIYPEYTGTALLAILKKRAVDIGDSEQIYDYLKKEFLEKFNIVWLKPLGFKNNYAFMMLKEKAEKLNIKNISDMKKYTNLIFGFNPEFVSREEFKMFKSVYDFKFKINPKIMDHALLYFSLSNGSIDVIDGFTTDGNILYYDVQILEDDKKAFPTYFCVPLIRKEILEKYPYLEDVINKLGGAISDEEMQQMNYLADYKGEKIQKIAIDFLKKKNLL